jgi:hypothetical protein
MLGKDALRTTASTPTQFAPRAIHVEDLPTDRGRCRVNMRRRVEIDRSCMFAVFNAYPGRRHAPSHA